MAVVIQKSAFKPGKYRGRSLTADVLRQFAEGTNKALAAGVPIPGLETHAKIGADDTETANVAATQGAGWLKKVDVESDGALSWELDVPDKIESGIKDGTIRFTSPEFRDAYVAADGRYSGPIIRHVAFTPLPKAHDQGPLTLAMSEGAYQFAEDDYEGPAENDPPDDASASEPENPDSPPKATDQSKLAALRECFSALGAELTSDWTFEKDGSVDELLACLKTLVKAKQEAEQKPADPQEPEVTESTMPFSEDDIAAMTPALQTKARKANAEAHAAHERAVQFAEERAAAKRKDAVRAVEKAKLPPGVRQKLLTRITTAQFSEYGETPTITVQQVAALIAEALPPHVQFDESSLKEPEHQDGEQFFEDASVPRTLEQAKKINDRIDADLGYPPRPTVAAT